MLLTVQAVLVAGYWLVERDRGSQLARENGHGTAPPRKVDLEFPALIVRHRDGNAAPLPKPTQPTVVHIWASWCPPCREELPGVLALPREHSIGVLALALDKEWETVDRLVSELDLTNVFLADGESVKDQLGVTDLPVTLFVNASGRITLRFDGPRDWTDPSFVASNLEASGGKR